MMMIDGISGCEEEINDRIGNLTNVTFVGGSAANAGEIDATYICANGKAFTDAAVLILMEPVNGFDVLKSQSFSLTDKVLEATMVDEKNRRVLEFNGRPAVEAYAEALGIPVAEVPDHFNDNPLGLVLNETHYFVRGLNKLSGTALDFYCRIKEGEVLSLLEMDDIVQQTSKDLRNIKYDTFNAIVEFNCICRAAVLNAENRTQDYADIFGKVPTISFSTFGESYIGHINQTSTMLLFK
jgi:hypothetical protein